MLKVLTLNNISVKGLERFPRDHYEVASEIPGPDAILVRSAKMHDMEIADSLKAVARAGAGTNNIPVERMNDAGVVVFNTPGANANAVKELVMAGLFMSSRNICQAWDYTRNLTATGDELNRQVEAGKKQFVGGELPGKTLAVIGLGAIGVEVANMAIKLGMRVVGYDPVMTVARAWQLSSDVVQAHSVEEAMTQSDFVTVHVPLLDATRHLVNEERLRLLAKGAVVLNFARGGIIDDQAVMTALDEGHLAFYLSDFPTEALRAHEQVIALPHLGASTGEAEENCAVMAANQLIDYLENGNIKNSINLPEAAMPRAKGSPRLSIVHDNVPNMVGQISTALADKNINIIDMLNKSREKMAYTLVDVENSGLAGDAAASLCGALMAIEGVRSVRLLD